METSLHRELKTVYAGSNAQFEVPMGKYRIDVVSGNRLVEIQHGTLSAIRSKVTHLSKDHKVWVVKPIVYRRRIVTLDGKGGEVVRSRLSPKRGRVVELFHDMIHFTRAFPHRNLTLDVPVVDMEEPRYPGHGRRRRRRKNGFVVQDQRLIEVRRLYRIRTPGDLCRLLICDLHEQGRSDVAFPRQFDTAELAELLDTDRWTSQRIAYALRETGATKVVGKRGNSNVYALCCRTSAKLPIATRLPNGQKLDSIIDIDVHAQPKPGKRRAA